ncbi:MAG: E3 ubiquitin-protein ligase Jade-2 [Paramarteilia canceri]
MECFSDLPCSKIDICSLNKFEKLVTDSRRLVRVSGRLRPSSLNSPIQVPSAERCATLPITFQKSSEKNKSNYPYIRLSREFISNQSADDSYSYSIDDLDMNWLNLYNREFSTSFTPNLMCNIINELEDGLHDYLFANGVSNLFEAQPIENANVYSETICQICYGIESESGNAIVICDGCNVAVHQSCYGIEERLPDGPWLCRPCQYGQSKPLCYLCANDLNGPFTSVRNREVVWAHSVCAHWIPEIIFGCMETCSNIRLMPGASKRKIYKCVVCGVSKAGFCISCSVEGCTKWFHPSCGFASNYGMVCFSNNSGEIIRKVY